MAERDNDLSTLNQVDYQILEFRPGQYVKIQNGEVIGPAAPEEVRAHWLQRRANPIDIGIIEVALAFSALSAFFAATDNDLVLRIIAAVAFSLGADAAGVLYWSYISQRIPGTFLQVVKRGGLGRPRAVIWLSIHWVKLLIKHFFGIRPFTIVESTELGYLTVLAGFVILWFAVALWILFSFVS